MVDEAGAREVIAALPDAIEGPLLDKESFRAVAARVRERTGLKGKALFHPIRVALTGSDGGPELDLAVPAIDRGAALPAAAAVAKIVELQGARAGVRAGDRVTSVSRELSPEDRSMSAC